MPLEIELRPGRRLLLGPAPVAPGVFAAPHSLCVADAGVSVLTRVRAESVTTGTGGAAWDLRARLEGMRVRPGVGARNVTRAHVRDGSLSLSRFAVLGAARGGTGASSHASGGVAFWGASGIDTHASLAFDAAGLRCPALRVVGGSALGHLASTGCVAAAVTDAAGLPLAARPLSLATVAAPPVTVEAQAARPLPWSAFDQKGELALLRVREYAADPGSPTAASLLADPAAYWVDISHPLNTKLRTGTVDVAAGTTHVALVALCADAASFSPPAIVAL